MKLLRGIVFRQSRYRELGADAHAPLAVKTPRHRVDYDPLIESQLAARN